MQIAKNKTMATTIALFLMLTMIVACFSVVNTANAIEWYTFISVAPNPIGEGQRVLIVFGFKMPTRGTAYLSYRGWTIIITKPDGTTDTIGPYNTDPTGTTFALFTPDKVGTYKIKAHYPGGYVDFTATAMNWSVPAADTAEISLTVQQEPIPVYQEAPLPTDYWTRPIYGENREWYRIGGDWLMPGYDTSRQFDWGAGGNGAFAPYTTVPTAPHILWIKPELFGGVVGGAYGTKTYYTGSAYRRELVPPTIIGGRLYYNQIEQPAYGFYCVDLYTGETIWYQNQTWWNPYTWNATSASYYTTVVQGSAAQLTGGQVLEWDTMNQHGSFPYLWATSGTTWARFDAWTGNLLNTFVNATAMGTQSYTLSFVFDKIGSLITYILDITSSTLTMWNSSRVATGSYSAAASYNINWRNGIQWNVTVPTMPGLSIVAYDPKDPTILIASNQTRGNVLSCTAFTDVAYSAEDGHLLWNRTRNEGTWEQVIGGRAMGDGIYINVRKETMQVYAYDATTGNKLWASEPRTNPWGWLWTGACIAYGKVYSIAYDGAIYAHDEKTGHTDWVWQGPNAGLEAPYGVYPLYGGMVIADGKIIVCNGEHSADSPLYRGERMYVVDAYNGTTLWSIDGWYQQASVANGYIVAPNGYDGQIYCFGKGSSATTVTASPEISVHGDSVMIKGTVTDQSPGQKGTPAISDDSMSAWMAYLHMQQPIPKNATGVTVSLDTLDPNGNFVHIGTVTSDMSGMFKKMWTPEVPGEYTVIATFAGSGSYGSSYAETAIFVEEAPPATPAPQYPIPADYTLTIIAAAIAIIIAVAIVGILILRKK